MPSAVNSVLTVDTSSLAAFAVTETLSIMLNVIPSGTVTLPAVGMLEISVTVLSESRETAVMLSLLILTAKPLSSTA